MKRVFLIFLLAFFAIAIPLCFFPIEIFPGEVVLYTGNKSKPIHTEEAELSLSYFFGYGYDSKDLLGIKSFYLTPKGYFLAFVVLFGIPFLIAYRSFLKKE